MSLIADICLSSPDLMLAQTIEAVPAVSVKTIYHAAATASVPALFYAVRGGTDALEEFDDALSEDPSVRETTVVESGTERRIYRVRLTSEQVLVVPRLVDLGGAFVQAHTADGNWVLKVRVPDRESLVAFKSFCDEMDVGFELRQLYRTDSALAGEGDDALVDLGLTAAQREALVTAYERGYFEEPRAASLRDLGEELDVSSTAVGGRIRRGTARLVEELLRSK